MEPSLPPPHAEPAVSAILARAEQAVARAGDRLLVERLHQALNEEGTAGLTAFSETLLPLLQALVIVLPRAVGEGTSPALLAAARTLGAALQERGIPLSELVATGLRVHARLLAEIAADLRSDDRALVTAMAQVSSALLEVERAVLLAYHEAADAALVRAALDDPATGLASRWYVDERLASELQLARRKERPLVLVLIAVEGADEQQRRFAALLRTAIRASDLATRRADGLFALLLFETDVDEAVVLLERLRAVAAAEEPPLRFRDGMAASPEQGLSVDALREQAEQALSRARHDTA